MTPVINPGGGAVQLPTLAEVAEVWVTANGNDANSGLAPTAGFASITEALSQLPADGGIINLGYGTFEGFDAASGNAIWIRGRGMGRHKSGDRRQRAHRHPPHRHRRPLHRRRR
jgi:hypothetical protein